MFYEIFLDLCNKVEKTPTAVVGELKISKGSVTNWKKGAIPNDVTLNKIANYFNVSVNYLLGNEGRVNISGNTLKGTYNVIGDNSQITNITEAVTAQEQELLSFFRNLGELDKAKAMLYVAELLNKEETSI